MSRPKSQPDQALCHPVEAAYCRGLCRKCYDSVRFTGKLPTTVSEESRILAEEAAGHVPRAGRKDFEDSQHIRTSIPKVADFVAGVVVRNAMDTEAAVKEIKPGLSPYECAVVAEKIEHDPRVQSAIEKTLQKRGLDKESKDHFVELLWKYAESSDPRDEKRQLQAWRLLGKGFIADRLELEPPVALPIAGATDMLRRMFRGQLSAEIDEFEGSTQ